MLSEQDVLTALPPHGFVTSYVLYAARQTTAPLAYHLGTALTLLAVCAPPSFGMFYAGPLYANLFTLLVGRSGEDQKSSALGIGHDLLMEVASQLMGDFPGSPEGLLESLQQQPTQLITMGEFGRFLASAQRGYMEPTKALLAELWDARDTQRRRANGKVIRVQSPRLSLLAACSIPYLETYTNTEDWTGGFMGRWAVLYAQRERTNPDPVPDQAGKPALIQFLSDLVANPPTGSCMGLSIGARAKWHTWFNDIANRELPSTILGIRSRTPTVARKAALLYALDVRRTHLDADWRVEEEELAYAIRFAELHVKSIVGLSERICEHDDARARREVLGALAAAGGQATLGELLKRLQRRKKFVWEVLESLLEEGTILRQALAPNPLFLLKPTTGAAPALKPTPPVPAPPPTPSWEEIPLPEHCWGRVVDEE